MLKIKKVILALVCLLALVFSWDSFIGKAQSPKPGGKPSAATQLQERAIAPQPPRAGVNYKVFDHTTHSLNCEECHVIAPGKAGERVKIFPGRLPDSKDPHAACSQCHSIVSFTRGASDFCVICHVTPYTKKLKDKFPDQRDDQFGMNLPHKIHVGLDVKDYDVGNIDIFEDLSEKERKVQEVAVKFGCAECHVKDGPEKKEENFSSAYHPECARCHGRAPKKILPDMYDCLDCHIPWMAIRPPVQNLALNFRHDKDHEIDTRDVDEKGKKIEKVKNKDGKLERPKLDCKFCHKETKSERLLEFRMPPLSSCTPCHSKEGGAHILTSAEAINLSDK